MKIGTGADVAFGRYFLQTLLFLTLFPRLLLASEGAVTYEKFYRLNKPLYRSDSGDLINFSYQSAPVDPTKKIDAYAVGDLHLYFQDNNAVSYSLQEGYARYQSKTFKFYIGRKILDWNTNEKYWALGYLNSLQNFTLLSTEEEGLTGLFFNKEIGNFEYDLFFSYLFVPQLNPSLDFKNGEVTSRVDWVRLPPKSTIVNGIGVPIYYNKPQYNISKIIFNKSLGANLKYKWTNGGVAAFAVYKPENKLRINASAYYDNINLNKVVVDASPMVNHQAYYGLQIFQAFGDVKARGGMSYVDPNAKLGKDFPVDISGDRKTFKSDYFTINPRYEKEAYTHMSLNLDRKSYILSLNYIHLLTHNTRVNDDFFSDAVKWKRALGGSITYFISDSFNIFLDLKYDFARYDNIVKSEIRYNYKNKVTFALGLEVLKAPEDESYWSYYRANDTLYSSLGFFF